MIATGDAGEAKRVGYQGVEHGLKVEIECHNTVAAIMIGNGVSVCAAGIICLPIQRPIVFGTGGDREGVGGVLTGMDNDMDEPLLAIDDTVKLVLAARSDG